MISRLSALGFDDSGDGRVWGGTAAGPSFPASPEAGPMSEFPATGGSEAGSSPSCEKPTSVRSAARSCARSAPGSGKYYQLTSQLLSTYYQLTLNLLSTYYQVTARATSRPASGAPRAAARGVRLRDGDTINLPLNYYQLTIKLLSTYYQLTARARSRPASGAPLGKQRAWERG